MAIYLVLLFVVIVTYFLYYQFLKNHNYWKERNVPYIKPWPLFGNYIDHILMKRHTNQIVQEICQQFPNEPYIGTFYGTNPALLIQDPNLLKLVLSKDFYYCNGRVVSDYSGKELLTKNMFFVSGDEWKVLRTNLTPLFSSVKLKNMYYLIKNCSDKLEKLLDDEIRISPNVDVKNLLAKYTIDCITTCAFGFSSETMKNDAHENPFIIIAGQVFEDTVYRSTKNVCRNMWPGLFYGLGFKLFADDVGNFFYKLLTEVFKKREETKSIRNDFIDLILTWKNRNCITGDSLSNIKTGGKKVVSFDVNDDLLLSQCVLFFAAGFETTSSTLSFVLYELAKNKIAQNKVIEEVDEYFATHDTIEYQCISSMPYIESCIEETLRLYPVIGLLTREVMHDYSLPTGLRLKKGDRIHIPVYNIQRHPEYFPEPEVFCPERFYGENKKTIKPFTYMPFGEGPRTCIGLRFAKIPMYAALLKIFKNYKVELAENMSLKLIMSPKSGIGRPIGGIHVKFIPRKT